MLNRLIINKKSMKKALILLTLVLLFTMAASPVFAAIEKPSDWWRRPFVKIWDALLDLQKQILSIEVIPGPPGPQGEPGPEGDCDSCINHYEGIRRAEEVTAEPGASVYALALCPAGKKAVGGGGRISQPDHFYLYGSYPYGSYDSYDGWIVYYHNNTSQTRTAVIEVRAICARIW